MDPQTLFPSLNPFTITTSTSPPVSIYGLTSSPPQTPIETRKLPLLLLHGFPQTLCIWRRLVPLLLASKHQVILLDLRGYGRSSKPRSPTPDGDHTLYAKTAMARDVHKVMSHLGHSRYNVLGHDRGGRVAHKLAVDYPDAVERVMFLDICPTLSMFERTDKDFAKAYWHWFFLAQASPFPEDAMTTAPDVFAGKMLEGMIQGRGLSRAQVFGEEAWADYRAGFEDWDTCHGWCEDYRAATSEDLAEQKADLEGGRKIKARVAVLWGELGVVEKMFDARKEWEKVCEEGRVEVAHMVEGCGHYIPEEKHEELMGFCGRFFGGE